MWSIPLLLVAFLAAVQLAHVIGPRHVDEIDREAAWLVRDHRLQQLAARLALAPAVVRWSRSAQLTNRIVLDIGGEELEAHCYHSPGRHISVVTQLFYRPSVGWIIGVDGPNGPTNLEAWLVDVHPVRAAR
jgi:hypothetical protein